MPKRGQIKRVQDSQVIARNAVLSTSLLGRCRGLLGKKALTEGEALMLLPCSQVHMLFMQFAIDVVFCSKANEIIYLKEHLQPWRISAYIRKSHYVVELPAGTISSTKLKIGDILEFRPMVIQ